MGMVVYSTNVSLSVPLTENSDHLELEAGSLYQPREGTHTDEGIAEMIRLFGINPRKNVPKVGVVLTDGLSKNPLDTAKQAAEARTKGINMFAVGVTNLIEMSELQAISSTKDQVIFVSSFKQLENAIVRLMHKVCPSK